MHACFRLLLPVLSRLEDASFFGFGEPSLRRALTLFTEHYHAERNRQGKDKLLLFPSDDDARIRRVEPLPVENARRLAEILQSHRMYLTIRGTTLIQFRPSRRHFRAAKNCAVAPKFLQLLAHLAGELV
jgi:hypothetical protein